MFRFHHTAMAAQFDIRGTHPDEAYARQAARMAFQTVDRLELQLSRFIENSDVSRINQLAAGEDTKVGVETMECLRLARLLYEETNGAFDPSVGTGFDHLDLIADAFAVRANTGGVRLDLGAIGKGYAVDRVADVLEDWEVARVLIDAGYSSVLALDAPDESEGWPLTLSLPPNAPNDGSAEHAEGANRRSAEAAEAAVFARLSARQRALGASGIRKGDHIRDPRTGEPVRVRQAAWVSGTRDALAAISRRAGVTPSPAAVADALSTAFMLVSPGEIDQYCHAHAVEAWILEEGVRHYPV